MKKDCCVLCVVILAGAAGVRGEAPRFKEHIIEKDWLNWMEPPSTRSVPFGWPGHVPSGSEGPPTLEWIIHPIAPFDYAGAKVHATGAPQAAGDLDGDGDIDVAAVKGWFENVDGKGSFELHRIKRRCCEDHHTLAVIDYDNDGDCDVFSGVGPLGENPKRAYLFENQSRQGKLPITWKEHVIHSGMQIHEGITGDVDQDGDVDIVLKPWNAEPHDLIYMENLSTTVERWDTYERSLSAASSYANPFQDVYLSATFTHESSNARLTVDGFHDGGDTWRFRFMPTQVGTWHWTTASNDRDLDGRTGTLECVTPTKPYLHGPLAVHGRHFVHADDTPRFLISTRLTCQFAPPSVWPALIAFLKESRINRVLFMMPGVDSKKDPVHTQRNLFAAGPDYTRYNVDAFRAIDEFINTLRQADILASPYFYYDPRREVLWKMTPEQDRAYIRYGMARFGAFSNAMPVLGNEIELKTTNYKDPAFDLKSHAWANEMGTFLKSRVVFGQPVSVHNPCWHNFAVNPSYFTLLKDWPFAAWTDFILKQAQVGCIGAASAMSDSVPQPQEVIYNERSYARHNQVLIDLRKFNRPVINEEPAYDMGSKSAYASQTPETMRPTFWTAATAGAYTIWGNKSTYVTGDPLPPIKESRTPQYMRVLHDVMVTLAYAEMEPHNQCVTPANVTIDRETWRTNFALVKPGEVYLVYSLHGGTGTVTLAPGQYSTVRVDPRDGTRTELGAAAGGAIGFSLPQRDWVLIYRRTAGGDHTPPPGSP